VNERRLRSLLHGVPLPEAEEAERRGRRMIEAAFAQRHPERRAPNPRRLAIALAAATLLLAVVLSPAGAAVRDWIDETLGVGVRDAEPALTEIPGGGRLLVSSPQGAWLVRRDGSRRLLGAYEEATWSPRGLFAAAASSHTLSAVAPDGTVRWSLSAPGEVSQPRWSPSGLRIAYVSGEGLRVVAGDGTGDALLDERIAAVAPAWMPTGPHVLAYLADSDSLRIVNADTGETVGSATAPPGVRQLSWAPDASRLVAASRNSLWSYEVSADKLRSRVDPGPPERLYPVPPAAVVEHAAFSPRGRTVAALLSFPADRRRPPRGELLLIDAAGRAGRALFRAPGRLSGLAWSPDGERLLIPWADADQWLFIPASGRGRVRAIGGISAEFDPGASPGAARFPRLDGWCCY
jgi:WD40-like Beta Propeller Repeat